MAHSRKHKLVTTVKDKCRMCYTCVRECPVKAIRILNGQAEILDTRCIGCGNCVKVCNQHAKVYLTQKNEVNELLSSGKKVVACIAPSFPAEFMEITEYGKMAGMIKKLGFANVIEVGFGADIIANEYKKLYSKNKDKHYISSDCPAIVFYIEQYYPEYTEKLAPIASPMVATTRIVKKKYGDEVKVVFIGPCIVKKAESDEVDEVLTFTELREMFDENDITPQNTISAEFDRPYAGKGAVFPLSRGLSQLLVSDNELQEKSLRGGNKELEQEIICASGRIEFRDAIKEFTNDLDMSLHLELLCCEGCIMGPGMSGDTKRYARQSALAKYIKEKMAGFKDEKKHKEWLEDFEEFSKLDYSQEFATNDRRIALPSRESVEEVLQSMGKHNSRDYLNCGACGYDTCEDHAVAIIQGLAENEMCLPFTIEKLHNYIKELNVSNEKLDTARAALIQSEKLAHMGQLSAGIAHELNNPLGIITMYSNILLEEAEEDSQMHKELTLIVEQSERCRSIVSGLLNFARKSHVNYSRSNLGILIERSIYSIITPENVKVKFENKLKNPEFYVDTEQMIQVFTNLLKNAVEAMPEGGIINITTTEGENDVQIIISDNGVGIKKEHLQKNIFEPFFTTKKVGQGTGLGLALIYGIIKMHRGNISVTSNADVFSGPTGTAFKITLPRNNPIIN